MAQIFVLYPSGSAFDHEYYLKTHMPLVTETWNPLGLISWDIVTFPTDAPYQVQATLKWETVDAFNAAAAGEGAKVVFGDIKNFTQAQPVLLKGEVVASKIIASS